MEEGVTERQQRSHMQREFDALEQARQLRYQERQNVLGAIQRRHDELHRHDMIPDEDALAHLHEYHQQAEQSLQRDEDGFQQRLAQLNQKYNAIQGSGIDSMEQKPRHVPFGRHVIHLPSLDEGVLNVKYKSLTRNPEIPKCKISDKLKDLLTNAIEGGKICIKKAHAL